MINKRSSTSALIPLLQEQKSVIERVRKNTKSIRESLSLHFDLPADADWRAFSEKSSILDSNVGNEESSFDDEISSFSYRRDIKKLASNAKTAQQNAKPDERHILNEPLVDLVELSQTHGELNAKSNNQRLTPNMASTRTTLHGCVKDLNLVIPVSNKSPGQLTNERHAAPASSSCMNGSSNDIPAYLRNNSRDAKEATRHHFRDDEYGEVCHLHRLSREPVQASDGPLKPSSRSTSIDAGIMKSLPRESESHRSGNRNSKFAFAVDEQFARGRSQMASPSTVSASAGENLETYHIILAYSELNIEEVETQHQYAANNFQGSMERSMDGGQYDCISTTKASENEGISGNSPVVKLSNESPESVEEKEISTNQVTYKEEPSEHGNIISSSLDLQSPIAEEETVAGLAAGPIKHDEENTPSRREYGDSPVQDNDPDSEHRISRFLDEMVPKLRDGVASHPSVANNPRLPRLLEYVDEAVRRLIVPEIAAALKEKQRMRNQDQSREPSHPDAVASPIVKISKPASDFEAPGNPKALTSRSGYNTDIRHRTDDTWDRTPEDGSPVTTHTVERGSSHDKGRVGKLDLAPNRSQTSLPYRLNISRAQDKVHVQDPRFE